MKYFTMQECIYSSTAKANGIDNTPSPEFVSYVVETVETLLDSLCEAWGKHCNRYGLDKVGIRISSGYRYQELNAVAGGPKPSARCSGYALDLIPLNGKTGSFKRFCCRFLAYKAFDQLISEGEDTSGMPCWMHVALLLFACL